MVAGRLRAVVCTSSLDSGVDWGDVDSSLTWARERAPRVSPNVSAAPITGSTEPSKAVLIRPTASKCWNAALRSTPSRTAHRIRRPCAPGRSDVLAQHVLGAACGEPFLADECSPR